MRIEHFFQALVAVLSLAAILLPVKADNSTIFSSHGHFPEPFHDPLYNPWEYPRKKDYLNILWQKSGEIKAAARKRGEDSPSGSIDCCPSVLEMVEPKGGVNYHGTLVELYQDRNVKQRFFELSCDRDIEGKPCRFMDRKLYNLSRCVQMYSYSYAIVADQGSAGSGSGGGLGDSGESLGPRHHHHREHGTGFPLPSSPGPSGSRWMLDYIQVRSGCSCQVTPPPTKKKKSNHPHKLKKNKIKKHNFEFED